MNLSFCTCFKTFFSPITASTNDFVTHLSVNKSTVWSLPAECAWMWMCVCVYKCAKCMSVYQHRCVSCSNPRSVENRLMASRKLWPLRHGPLPLLQLLPSLSASLFVEIMPLTTEAYTRIPDLPIYSVTRSVSEMITRINYSLLLWLFFWPRIHTQPGHREHWWWMMDAYSCTQGAHRVSMVLHIKGAHFCLALACTHACVHNVQLMPRGNEELGLSLSYTGRVNNMSTNNKVKEQRMY